MKTDLTQGTPYDDRVMPMEPLEQEIRALLADEAKRQRCNGLSRKIANGSDINPRTLVAIEVVKAILAPKL